MGKMKVFSLMFLAIFGVAILDALAYSYSKINLGYDSATFLSYSKGGGCCSSSSPCSCSGGSGTSVNIRQTGDRAQDAITAGLTYYQNRYNDDAVTATATDLGCHIEVDILKDGKPIMKLAVRGNSVTELSY
ncbi:MAG: hypothetical protein HY929_04200 [Euryarchaeota archaeon]|nr:hypothetical protein [Euryarchaeota archaeon]